MNDEFTRLKIITGQEKFDILSQKHVVVFGLGGVGGFATEALARSAIGELTIVDFDTVDITNINRQIIATNQTIGRYKTEVFEERLKNINKNIKVNTISKKYTKDNSEEFFSDYDYIIDAIDMVSSKIHLIKTAYEKNLNIISSMGMGNRLDPSKIRLTTLDKTSNCPLARVMRRQLKQYGITKLKCVYSVEDVTVVEKNFIGNKMINGSSAFVPSVAGITMASEIVRGFLSEK